MAKVVVVDKNDRIIEAIDRDIAIQKGLIRRIARIFLFDNKGRLFLQKRSHRKKTFPNAWGSSAAGHVEEGESYLEAAKRELKEELGIEKAKLIRLMKFYSEADYKDIHLREFSVLYKAVYLGEDINMDKEETWGGKWFYPDEIEDMLKENPNNFTQGFTITWRKFKAKL